MSLQGASDIFRDFNERLDAISDNRQKVDAIIDLTIVYGDCYRSRIVPLLEKGIALSRQERYTTGEIICYFNIIFQQLMTGGRVAENDLSREMGPVHELVAKIRHDKQWGALGTSMAGYFHWYRGEFEKGFDVVLDQISTFENKEDPTLGWIYFALGVFYFDTKDPDNSEKYYRKAKDIFRSNHSRFGVARAQNGLASIAIIRRELPKALKMLEECCQTYRELAQLSGLSRSLNDMGLIEKSSGKHDQAILLFQESIALRKELGHVQGLITSYTELGETYFEKKDYPRALSSLLEGLSYSEHAGAKQKGGRLHKLISDTYKKLNDIPKALEHFEAFYSLRSEIMSDEAANNIKRIQARFEREKAEKEAELERLKHEELSKAYEVIEQKNKDITDSIQYAKRIQQSLLPSEKQIEKTLKRLNNM